MGSNSLHWNYWCSCVNFFRTRKERVRWHRPWCYSSQTETGCCMYNTWISQFSVIIDWAPFMIQNCFQTFYSIKAQFWQLTISPSNCNSLIFLAAWANRQVSEKSGLTGIKLLDKSFHCKIHSFLDIFIFFWIFTKHLTQLVICDMFYWSGVVWMCV